MPNKIVAAAIVAASFTISIPGASAQAIKPPVPMKHFTAEEAAAVAMPDLAFEATADDVADFEKFFYFHRDGTDFSTAFADISECDALASGVSYYGSYAGGGVIGSAVSDLIYGSAERRRIRRINLRNCMGYKEYSRYGMERERWQKFNFEEGNYKVSATKRQAFLMKQARVASGPKPVGQVLAK